MSTFSAIMLGVFITFAVLIILQRLIGFMAQRPSDYTGKGTEFDIREQLDGDILCEGVIYGPFGRVNTRFVATMNATWDGDLGRMTEAFKYDTGGTLDREWTLSMTGDGTFDATAPDIIGTGKGFQSGSGASLKYTLKLPAESGGYVLKVTDWMYLMENGTIINRSHMRIFGIKVGELVATMRKVKA